MAELGAARLRDYVLFSVADTAFALPVEQVKEIVDGGSLEPPLNFLPAFPGFVALRERTVPAYSLNRALGFQENQTGGSAHYIVTDTAAPDPFRYIAFGVDEVSDILQADTRHLSDIPRFGVGDELPLHRILDIDGRLVVVLEAPLVVGRGDRDALNAWSKKNKGKMPSATA